AFASGFASVRQFNDTIRTVYAATPSALRATAPRAPSTPASPAGPPGIPLRLSHRGPYHSAAVFDLLAREAVTGVEELTGGPGSRTYRRTLRLPYGTAIAAVEERGTGPRGRWLDARLHLTDLRDLTTAVQRLRRLFDLDSDPYAVDEHLGADPRLARLVALRPGLRSPGAADPAEAAVRALVGRAAAERLVSRYGKPLDAPSGALTHLFPEPEVLAEAAREDDTPLGHLTAALADGTLRLDPGADRDEASRALHALPGLDARTVAVVRARALGDPDVAPPGVDVPDTWRPWRSYALHHLIAAGEWEPASS
ncbi:AlkA N-terminal domain-containing protein, partial [Streptomyces graminilatus]|uniref:AlkA N-terminal domain-containing protein n=1 Tax=Streptomyces graminilatus TaxID=1464070 RepID=UPI000AF949CA